MDEITIVSKKYENKILIMLQYRKREKHSHYCVTVVIMKNVPMKNITMRSGKTSSEFRFIVFY